MPCSMCSSTSACTRGGVDARVGQPVGVEAGLAQRVRPCSCRRGRRSRSRSARSSSPAAARLPTQPVPKRGSSPAQATTSIERRGAHAALRAARAPPRSRRARPARRRRRPALSVVSTCEPVSTTGASGSPPAQRPKRLPTASSRVSRPAARMRSATHSSAVGVGRRVDLARDPARVGVVVELRPARRWRRAGRSRRTSLGAAPHHAPAGRRRRSARRARSCARAGSCAPRGRAASGPRTG